MRYFKAITIVEKPFIQWASWANNEKELLLINDAERSLILAEDEIPLNIYGVCPLEIIDGQLVLRSEASMLVFKREFLNATATKVVKELRLKLKDLFYEIQFTKGILEDAQDLELLYDTTLREYNDLK